MEIPEGTNQGTHVHGDPCSFPCFGDISSPMMATLNLIGFTVGLLVWLFSTCIVPNGPDASQVSIVCQDHQIKANPFLSSSNKYSPASYFSSGESVDISSQESKKKKRKSRNKKTT